MASEAVSIALSTVQDLLIEEAKFIRGVSDQVKEVETELINMQCLLKDAERRQHKDERVANFVKEIRTLAYRIENVLETYAIQVQSNKEGRGFKNAIKRLACIFSTGIALHKVGSEIASIKTKFDSLTTSLLTYGVVRREITASEGGQSSAAISDQNQQRLRQTYPHQVEEYFVGMKDDITQLVSLMTDDERSHRVISIYGMGGLGKTTLARKIYNHNEVQSCFKTFAWVSISQQFTMENVLRRILKQLLPDQKKETVWNMEETELVMELYKVQKESKCLVVLDDLWKINDWKCISSAFPFAESNSKILITTRDKSLAEVEFPYPLNFLSEDEGWELLRQKAFAKRAVKDSEIDPKLEDVGREIVVKCGKLPLAISALGGILSQKCSLHDWQTVNKDVDFYLRMSEGSKEGYGAVLQVLALSYDELPYHLKPCFLHLGHFREDEDIKVEMLYRMWTAEGMVSEDHGATEEALMDVAERYLLEMSSRSMVQVELDELPTGRRVKSCRLHDLMRDFCLARGKEVDFLKLLNFGLRKDPLSDSPKDHFRPSRCAIHLEYNRYCVQENDAMINMALEANGQFRSLLITNKDSMRVKISFPRVIYDSQKFKFLRVLIFERYDFKGRKLPRGIKKLIHLRLLSFNDCLLDKLPSSIVQLQYLQTLDIRVENKIQMPDVLWKLKRLRHLYLPYNYRTKEEQGKLGLFGLSKVETLVNFCNEDNEFRDLLGMINLHYLHAQIKVKKNDNIVYDVIDYLNSNQHKLKETRFGFHFDGEDSIVPVQYLVACLNLHYLKIIKGKCEFQKLESPNFYSNVIELELWDCAIEGDPMEFLGKLSNLRRLELFGVELVDKKVMICYANSFPKLIHLELWRVNNLEKWMVDEGAMPNLSSLGINCCDQLNMIPERLITALKEVRIFGMPEEFKQRVQVLKRSRSSQNSSRTFD